MHPPVFSKIVKMGPGTENSSVKVGDRVGIKWISAICGSCPACLSGHDGVCFNQKVSGYVSLQVIAFICLSRRLTRLFSTGSTHQARSSSTCLDRRAT